MISYRMSIDFSNYLKGIYPAKSGTISSYKKALKIIDNLFLRQDVFNLNGQSVVEIKDPVVVSKIMVIN